MKRLGTVILAVLFFGGNALSQTAEEVVENMDKTLQNLRSLQARFEHLYYSMSVSTPLEEKGELFLQKPSLMRWEYRDPAEKVFLFKEGMLHMYVAEDKQLTRSRISPEAYDSEILGIFVGTESFSSTYIIEDNPFPSETTNVRQVKLTPRVEGEYSHILLEIDEKTWLITKAVFIDWVGNKQEFHFSRVRTNIDLPPKTFDLVVPPGTEIIEDAEIIRR